MDEFERALIVATQRGLPLVPRPYAALAGQLGCSEREVIEGLRNMLLSGRIRRIGAVPNHYAIGYTANGMTVWDVLDEEVDQLGMLVGQLPFVTHCYRRPRSLPEWPYNLFAMVHGESQDEVRAHMASIRSLLGTACRVDDVLFSTAILKKTGLRLAA